MKILLLGGTGAMGASLVELLAMDEQNQVYVTSRKERKSFSQNVVYYVGNALEEQFLQSVLTERYDAIIDFMVYKPVVFERRVETLLDSTKQYFFLSSSRVYSDADELITEKTPRLLDVCNDSKYLATDEYALAKAREENILLNNSRKNWTIIRPYITYNIERLQCGALEKEGWLFRALEGKKIVFSEDIANRVTSMTYGGDVAKGIAALIGKKAAYGEAFHIVGSDTMTWGEVLELYCDVIENLIGNRPQVDWVPSLDQLWKVIGNEYQVRYDRLYDRRFDNKKFIEISEGKVDFVSMRNGLTACLEAFVNTNKLEDIIPNMKLEACLDRMTGEKELLRNIDGYQRKLKYFGWRYAPHLLQIIKK